MNWRGALAHQRCAYHISNKHNLSQLGLIRDNADKRRIYALCLFHTFTWGPAYLKYKYTYIYLFIRTSQVHNIYLFCIPQVIYIPQVQVYIFFIFVLFMYITYTCTHTLHNASNTVNCFQVNLSQCPLFQLQTIVADFWARILKTTMRCGSIWCQIHHKPEKGATT